MKTSDIRSISTVRNTARLAVCLVLALATCLTLASCGNRRLYATLEGLWCVDDASVVVRIARDDDGVRTISIIDESFDVVGVGGYYTIDGDVLVINSSSAEHIGGSGRAASIPFSYDEESDVLTLEYNEKVVKLSRWEFNVDMIPDRPQDTDTESVTD